MLLNRGNTPFEARAVDTRAVDARAGDAEAVDTRAAKRECHTLMIL